MNRFRPPQPGGAWTRRSALLAAAGLAACGSPELVSAPASAQRPQSHPLWPTEGPPVLRGAVIAQRRRRVDVDGQTFGGGGSVLPEYGSPDFEALAEAGANLVVMSFPEFWTVGPPYKRDAAMADALGRQLDLAKAAGLYVVVALRSGPGRSDFIFHRDSAGSWFPEKLIVDSIWTNADEQDAWSAMCVDMAKLLKDRPEIAGLNLMVEPEPNIGGVNRQGKQLEAWTPQEYLAEVSTISDWKRIAGDVAKATRAAASNLPILISPPAFARTDFLSVMGEPPVPNTVWCVHDYEPRDYTHQPEHTRGVLIFDEQADAFVARLDAARKQNAPVFLGEFGAARWADKPERYYAARIAACESRTTAWAAFRWPTGDAAYEKSDSTFNLTWGPKAGSAAGAALSTLRPAWGREAKRPTAGPALRGRT